MNKKHITIDLGNNKKLTFETGQIARQAHGSILLHCGDTTILATACASKLPLEDADFLPLKVDYSEKFSSAGKTLGGFIKREGKPTTHQILTSRLIDRSLRPLFEDGYYHDIQVLSYVFSFDGKNSPDVLSICASSAALLLSHIPFIKPLAGVRVGYIDDQYVINPSVEELKQSRLDLILSGTEDAIIMIEGYCDFFTEQQIIDAIEFGHTYIKKICSALSAWQKEIGKDKDRSTIHVISKNTEQEVENFSKSLILNALNIANKKEREIEFDAIKEKLTEALLNSEESEHSKRDVMIAFKKLSSKLMREMIIKDNKRIDGRKFDEIRKITIDSGFLKRTHGSCLFTRGETQSIAVCTLGGETMAQRYEDLHGEGLHRFYLQYFFPPFSVGEVGKTGFPGRREIGHGKLAERALIQSLPRQEDFPYVIRLESNITESNGSSSMASVCGGCIALMNAGVPISRPVSGIAMGLILEGDEYKILSDIIGTEDALGDMDFKLTGDHEGITAFQMDIKVEGITKEIMYAALMQAKKGRAFILDKMLSSCPKSSDKMSIYAPRIVRMKINPSKIGTVIGPGGKQIRAIIEETGVDMDISDEGIISITSNNPESMKRAQEIIHELTDEVEIGQIFKGKITTIKPFGLFVKLSGGKEGFCHISEVSRARIKDLNDLFKEGDLLEVKVTEINDRGQIRVSHKALLAQELQEK